jgi:hypothetical protein
LVFCLTSKTSYLIESKWGSLILDAVIRFNQDFLSYPPVVDALDCEIQRMTCAPFFTAFGRGVSMRVGTIAGNHPILLALAYHPESIGSAGVNDQ